MILRSKKGIGTDCKNIFKAAYENRYSWDSHFSGYQGSCSWTDGSKSIEGKFFISNDLKLDVKNVEDQLIAKAITSQIWDISIHRIKRPFDQIHSENSFEVGNFNDLGMEVIVSGKNKGDMYCVKDNVITMVHRHIHGKLINVLTQEVFNTGNGYLSKKYTSQYLDPLSSKPISEKLFFVDKYTQFFLKGPYVLSERSICNKDDIENSSNYQIFSFYNLTKFDKSSY